MRTARRTIVVIALTAAWMLAAAGCLVIGTPTSIPSGSRALDVDDHGVLVGNRWTTNPLNIEGVAFRYDTTTGTTTDLGGLGGTSSSAQAINADGVIVGWAKLASGQQRAFRYESGSGMASIGVLAPEATTPTSSAADINAAGVIVGWSNLETGEVDATHAFVRQPGASALTDLGTLGGTSSAATGVNDAGIVVGWSEVAGGERHAFVHDPATGVMTDLGAALGGPSEAAAVNDAGLVVGTVETGGDPCADHLGAPPPVCPVTQAFVHDLATGLTTVLPIPSGGVDTHIDAVDVNDDGVLLATATDQSQPVCSHCSPPMRTIAYELGTSGVYHVAGNQHAAGAISDSGFVVGTETSVPAPFTRIPLSFHTTIERIDP